MGVKSEKKRLTKSLGLVSENPEFIENLFDQINYCKLPEASKQAIKNALAKKYKEFKIIGNSAADRFMRQNLHQFHSNITFDEKYQDCVIEIQNNFKRVNLSNLFTEIRNSINKKRRK